MCPADTDEARRHKTLLKTVVLKPNFGNILKFDHSPPLICDMWYRHCFPLRCAVIRGVAESRKPPESGGNRLQKSSRSLWSLCTVALFAAAGSKTRQQGQCIAAFFMLVERRVSLVSPPDSCVLGVQLFLQYFHLCAVNMGNQCLKKISDADKDGYKQHNQM